MPGVHRLDNVHSNADLAGPQPKWRFVCSLICVVCIFKVALYSELISKDESGGLSGAHRSGLYWPACLSQCCCFPLSLGRSGPAGPTRSNYQLKPFLLILTQRKYSVLYPIGLKTLSDQ